MMKDETFRSGKDRDALKKQRQDGRFIRKEGRVGASYLRRMRELGEMPAALAPFLEALETVYVDLALPTCLEGRQLIGTYCVMAPHELIYAAGAVPVKLCSGSYTAYSVGDGSVPRDACPLVKAVEGFSETGLMPLYSGCSLMAVPVTCDCKKKIAGLLREWFRVFPLHVPAGREDGDINRFVEELYRFAGELEDVTGNRITRESLADGMETVGRAQYELSRFIQIRKKKPGILWGTHALAVMNSAACFPADVWAGYLHDLNRELDAVGAPSGRSAAGKRPRILVTGSPVIFPNVKIPLLIEELGGVLAAEETCMGERGMSDPAVVVDGSFDGMLRALANRSIRPCSCPTFADNAERVFRIRQMIRDHHVQGVIYHVLRGCLVYDFEYRIIEEALGGMGIPVIRIESDYNEEDVEQLRIRLEAFIELIKFKDLRADK